MSGELCSLLPSLSDRYMTAPVVEGGAAAQALVAGVLEKLSADLQWVAPQSTH